MTRVLTVRLNPWWRAFLYALAIYAVLGAIALALDPELGGVFLLGLYCIPANSVFPFPHEPAVLFFAQFYDPLWIALAATAGSIIASFSDYALVGAALHTRALAGTRNSRVFKWAVGRMQRWPFAIVVLFSFLPLPISVIRVLAPASGYPIGRYIVAQLVGRLPRFYILALIGQALVVPTWVLLALTLLIPLSMLVGPRDEDDEDADEDADLASASIR